MNLFGKIRRQFVMLGALCALCLMSASGWAQQSAPGTGPQNSIDNLQVSQQQGMTIVKLTMKKALSAPPASFSIAAPARVAFDFADTGNDLGRNVQQLNEGELRSINIIQVGDRTRLVMNLNKLVTYETRIDGVSLYISLMPATAASGGAGLTGRPRRWSSDYRLPADWQPAVSRFLGEPIRWNQAVGFALVAAGATFVFKPW